MTSYRVTPATVEGRLAAPPSKSYTHRALIVGHLAGRRFDVHHPLYADDTLATRRALPKLGTETSGGPSVWQLTPGGSATRPRRTRRISCGESGTTLRFLSAVAARTSFPVRFEGAPGLASRPMAGLVAALRSAGCRVRTPRVRSLPMTVEGPLRAGSIRVDGSVSSQYVSALLMVLPTLPRDSRLTVTGAPVSRPYIDATLAMLQAHGVTVVRRGRSWSIPGGQRYRGRAFDVPGDASSGAYLWAAAAITGGRVSVRGVPGRWPQADRAVLGALAHAGATVRDRGGEVTVQGPVTGPIDEDLTESPDLYPLLGAIAAVSPFQSRLRGAEHVVYKESDRQAATVDLIRRIGGSARRVSGGLSIDGTSRPRAIAGLTSTDHRVVMSAAVAALAAHDASTIDHAGAVGKSYPRFWADLRRLGVPVEARK